jgi:hypothetical protein
MPGLRKEVDTSEWTARDWRSARTWHVAFLVGWIAFFGVAIRAHLEPVNWYLLTPTLLIAVIGCAIQVIWLVRISIWLDNQKNSKAAP